MFLISLILVFLMFNQIESKAIVYFNLNESTRSIYDFVRLSLFFLMALWYSGKKTTDCFYVYSFIHGGIFVWG